MELKDIQKFIKKEDARLRKKFPNEDRRTCTLARMVKISEETGELADEVLNHVSMQRKDKLDAYDKNNLSHEFADVILTTLLLAEVMDVDIEKALKEKIKKINKRYK